MRISVLVIRQIAERFRPQQVILFGSQATGASTGDSDVDVLVILDTEEPSLHAAARIAAAVDHPIPLDILVRTPSEWQASLARGATFATSVAKHRTVVYQA